MGMQEQIIKGVYKNSKHRVRMNQTVENYYYKGRGLMKSNVGLWSNYGSSGWGQMPGCPDFWDYPKTISISCTIVMGHNSRLLPAPTSFLACTDVYICVCQVSFMPIPTCLYLPVPVRVTDWKVGVKIFGEQLAQFSVHCYIP